MSFPDKQESILHEEWMKKLEGVYMQRSDMNKLIMNYLVTGLPYVLMAH